MDFLAGRVISLTALSVLLILLSLFLLLFFQAFPLFSPGKVHCRSEKVGGRVLSVFFPSLYEKSLLLTTEGGFFFSSLSSPPAPFPFSYPGTTPYDLFLSTSDRFFLLHRSGKGILGKVRWEEDTPSLETIPLQISLPSPIRRIAFDGKKVFYAKDREIGFCTVEEEKECRQWEYSFPEPPLTFLSHPLDFFLLVRSSGEIWVYQKEKPPFTLPSPPLPSRTVSSLAWMPGKQAIVLGDTGGVVHWGFFYGSPLGGRFEWKKRLPLFSSPVVDLVTPGRNHLVLSVSKDGEIRGVYPPTERSVLTASLPSLRKIFLHPSGKFFIGEKGEEGEIAVCSLYAPHPEAGWKAYFGKVLYEGREEEEYVWQSTGGSDTFQPKFSLVPLILGTWKAVFFALLFAFPLGLLAGIYVSQFFPRRYRGWIKAILELMASFPSVVVGAIGALFLAPFIADHLFTVLSLPLCGFFGFLLFYFLYSRFCFPNPSLFRFWVEREYLLVLLPFLLFSLFAILFLPSVEKVLFPQGFLSFLTERGIPYETRNGIVVGVSLGFAVVPIVFTLVEDALSGVPESFRNAALALGATRMQAVLRVVLPSALPGIAVAFMIGMGRAVGETMIVLMASGNSPKTDFHPFTGLRSLSANIAVELPEAPVDGTLYRTLFFSGLLLFLFTLFINTLSQKVQDAIRARWERRE